MDDNPQQPGNTDSGEAQSPLQPPSQLEAHYENNRQQSGRGEPPSQLEAHYENNRQQSGRGEPPSQLEAHYENNRQQSGRGEPPSQLEAHYENNRQQSGRGEPPSQLEAHYENNRQQSGSTDSGEAQSPLQPPSQIEAHYENNQQQPGRGEPPSQLEAHYENNRQQSGSTDSGEAQSPLQPPSQIEAHYENNQQQPGSTDHEEAQSPLKRPSQQPGILDVTQDHYEDRNRMNQVIEMTQQFKNQDLPKSMLLNEIKDLERKAREIVPPEELTKALNAITKTIEDKLNEIYEFKGRIFQIGSSVDGTKTGKADEFDYLYVINRDSLEHKGQDRHKLFFRNEELKAKEIAEDFMNKLDEITTKLDLTNLCLEHGGFASPSYSGCRRNGPAATLLFHSTADEVMLISMDFTIAFPLAPDEERKIRLDIARKAGPLLPCQDKTAEFLIDTLCLVAVEPDKDVWRVSTARLEATFLGKLPKDHCLKIAMRYGKILSKKQISDIPDTSYIFYNLGPENVVIENMANYKDNPTERYLRDLQKYMRLAHYHLTPPQGQKYSELTGSILKLDSACIKHLALRIVCKDHPELADAEGEEESALIIIGKIIEELANPNNYVVENYLIEHKIKMVSVAMYAGPMWETLAWYAKKRCEQFLTDNELLPSITQPLSQEQPQPLPQSPEGITEVVVKQNVRPDAYIAGRDSNTSDTVLSEMTISLNKSQYSADDLEERMKRLVTATKQSRMDKPQIVPELADYAVSFDEHDCPEHTFLVRFKKDELIAKDYPVIGKITNALLNAIGGILILESTYEELNEREMAAWHLSCTHYMERFMSEQIVRSKSSPSRMIMFIPKSQNLRLYNGCIITRSPSGNVHNLNYNSLVDILNRKSEADHYVQMNPSCCFDEEFPHREGQNREYKHWEVTSLEDIINHISPCPHPRHPRAPKNVRHITPRSKTKQQEAAKKFCQTLLAMANEPCGGEVIIGIAEIQVKLRIKGLHLEDADREGFEDVIDKVLSNDPVTGEPRIWREPGRFPEKNTHWRVRYHEVIRTPGDERRVIARIQINHYLGGVFEVEPLAYDVDQDGYITQKPFAEWRERIEGNIPKAPVTDVKTSSIPRTGSIPKTGIEDMNQETPDSGIRVWCFCIPHFCIRVDDETSYETSSVDPKTMNAALVNRKELSWTKDKLNWSERLEDSKFKVENYVTSDSYFELKNPLNFTPSKEIVLRRHPFSDVKIKEIEKYHQSDRGFVICVKSWMSHLMVKTIPEGHVTDLLVFFQKEGISKGLSLHELHLWVICGTEGDQKDDWRYAIQTSLSLKRQLIEGGCPGISVICHTLHGDNEIRSSEHQEEIMKYLCRELETVELMKKTLTKILFQKDLYFTNRVGNRALINLTEKQAETLFMSDFSPITFIRGPPGSGKTILAMCLIKQYDPKKVLFVCTTESFQKYISFSRKCMTCFVKSAKELKEWIQSEGIKNIKCLIFDDVHNLECTREDWYTILVQLVKSGKYIHLFADPDIQAYKETNSVKSLRWALLQIEDEYRVTAFQKQLTEVHRNTRKVTAFIIDAVSENTSPGRIQIKAANSLDGDDIETKYDGGLYLEGADNGLVVLIQELTLVYPPRDIAVLLGGEKAVEDKIFYIKVLSQHLECKVHGADHNPREGVQVDIVDEYLGLEAPVVVHLNSKPTPTTQIDNPKYRSFIASRGIFRVIFLVQEPLNHQHYKQMNLDKPLEHDDASSQHGKSSKKVPISEVPVGVGEAVSPRASIPDYEAARLSQEIHKKDIGVEFFTPCGIATCPKTGNVAVTSDNNHCIYLLSPDLQKIRKFGERGSGDDQYRCPQSITFTASGDMFITDTLNHRIQHVSPEGRFLQSFGTQGQGEFDGPVGICWAAGLLYVSDSNNWRIEVLQDRGEYITSIGREYFPSEGPHPRRISVSVEHDTVAVLDYHGNLLLLSLKGQIKETFRDGDPMYDAEGVVIDRLGQVVVVDGRGVVVLGQDRKLITRIPKPEGEWNPRDITITLTGDIIIADVNGNRLIKYDVPHKAV